MPITEDSLTEIDEAIINRAKGIAPSRVSNADESIEFATPTIADVQLARTIAIGSTLVTRKRCYRVRTNKGL